MLTGPGAGKSEQAKAEWTRGSLVNLVAIPLLPYLAWAILYYIKVPVNAENDVVQGN